MIIQADGFKLTDALRDYTKSKLKKLDRYNLTNLKCLLKIDGRDQIVEIVADDRFLKTTGGDMYSTVVKAVNAMQIILGKHCEQ